MSMWLEGPEFFKYEDGSCSKQTWKRNTPSLTEEIKREFVAAIRTTEILETPKIENFIKRLCLVRSTAILLETVKIWKGKWTKKLTAGDLIQAWSKGSSKNVSQKIYKIYRKENPY